MKMNYGYTKDGQELTTQWETILYHLKSNPGMMITSGSVLGEFGFSRLASIVDKIQKKTGLRLSRKMVKRANRYGGYCHVMAYWYEAE